jgi:hypothetical protein
MVINLFFQEGEKARAEYQAKLKADQARAELENKKLADRLSNQGTVGLIFSGFGFWISDAYTATKNISVSVGSAIADTGSFVGEIGLNVGSLVAIGGAQAVARSTEIATNYIVDTAKSLGSNLSASFAYVNNGLAAVFGVGQSTNFNTTNVNSLSVENEKTKLVEEDNGDMVIPTVVENNSTSGITTQQVQDFIKRFQEIYNQPKVENNTLSNVQKSYTGGMTFVPIYISNGTSAVVPAEVPPEATTSESSVILPAISLIDDPCAQSVATDGCLLVSTSTEISWQSTSTDTAYYSLNLNGVISTTTATSAPISLKDNQEYIFSVSSVTTVGTSSLPIQRKILHKDLPVIINEINWSGTIASIDDQWLELKNNTDYNISLNNFKVVNGSSTLEIPIHGAIKPNDYFVLEKKNASSTEPIKDLASYDWREWTGWLSMEGEDLYLIYSKDSLEKMIDYVPYCENWCNFGQPGESLERYDSEVGTNDLSSDWSGYSYYDYDVKNGLDRDDNDIYGTPGQRNGFSYLINKGQDISSEVVLKNDLVYFTQSDLNILENGSFAAGPGTVIKLRPRSNLNVLGKVYIRGEGDDLAVITSWEDGSLLNGINLYGGASGSIFNNLKLQNIKRGISGVDVKDLTFSNIEYSNGGGYQRILFNFDNSKVEISNLIGMSLSGELAHFENNSSVKFSNVVIKDETNALDSILSIYKNSEATVDYLEVKNNFCLFSCVSAYNNSKLSVSNSIFNNYSLDFGSAVDVYDYSQAVINNTKVLSGNQGIFTSDNGYSEIVDTEFSDIYYSAITSTRGGKVLGQRLNIHDNKIGAFSYYNLESTNTITDSLFVSNELAVLKGLRQGFTDDLNWLQDEQGPDELKYSMDLKNNWWGDLTGPKNERLNPDGKGDSVSDGVEFSPWYLDYNTKKLNTVLSNDKPEIEIFPDEEISTTTDDQIPETGNATTTDMLGSESDLLLQTASTTTDTI